MRTAAWVAMAAALLGVARPAAAAGEDQLAALINERRADTRGCSGARETAVGPLAPSPRLAAVDARTSGNDLGAALIASGYRAAKATAIVVSGVRGAAEAARIAYEQHCDALRDRRYAEVGIARSGTTWRINLAQPLLANDLGEWRAAGHAVLELVNEARARGGVCGQRRFAPTPPLAWNDLLAAAALAHSRDMAENDYFEHVDPRGRSVTERATEQGYRWRVIGENIAGGQGSPALVVAGWLASPGHCANMLSADFTEMGAAYALNPRTAMDIYWTQVFGRR